MSPGDAERRLFWHGVLLVLLGLVAGALVQSVRNPRMGLSAHVGTVMNGTLLVALGAAWGRLTLSPRAAVWALWLLVIGSYASSAALFLAAIFGTSRSTPLAGAGYSGTPWQEALVDVGLSAGAVAVLMGCALALWGLRSGSGETGRRVAGFSP
jgi:hydroxylaminobenzene mutase